MNLKHYCSTCESKYTINYREEDCEDNPQYCPFCASYILEDEVEQDEE